MDTKEITQRLVSERNAIDQCLAALGAQTAPAVAPMANVASSDLLHGTAAIGKFLGVTARQVRNMAETTDMPTVKIGHFVCARRGELDAWLSMRGRG